MANWYGASRSNYFRVKDEAAFRAALRPLGGIEVWDEEGRFAVGDVSGEGWPSAYYNDEGEFVEVDIVDLISEHLADGEVCVLMTSGAEKLRYVTGRAIAFTNKASDWVAVDLDDIYERAEKAFGLKPTLACY